MTKAENLKAGLIYVLEYFLMLQLFHMRLYQKPEVSWLDAKGDLSAAHTVVDLGNKDQSAAWTWSWFQSSETADLSVSILESKLATWLQVFCYCSCSTW